MVKWLYGCMVGPLQGTRFAHTFLLERISGGEITPTKPSTYPAYPSIPDNQRIITFYIFHTFPPHSLTFRSHPFPYPSFPNPNHTAI